MRSEVPEVPEDHSEAGILGFGKDLQARVKLKHFACRSPIAHLSFTYRSPIAHLDSAHQCGADCGAEFPRTLTRPQTYFPRRGSRARHVSAA